MTFPELKNDLLLRALNGETVPRPPVWMMRQAGRYLPEYRALQAQYDFFTRVQTPELATEITLQPIDILQPDAAIIFSDILVMLQALGVEVQMRPGEGPVLPQPLRTAEDALALGMTDIHERLHYVFAALTMTRQALNGRAPLIGFAGAPWTLFCYLVEGRGSKDFARAKGYYFSHPDASRHVLDLLTQATITYLNAQIAAGAQAVQVFDSWAGMLGPEQFAQMALPYLRAIVAGVQGAPVIVFAKGAWYALAELAATGAAALGVDWALTPQQARAWAGPDVTLQGNFDPAQLLAPIPEIEQMTKKMLQDFGSRRYIANLGHGILPEVPVAHAQAFIDTVKSWNP